MKQLVSKWVSEWILQPKVRQYITSSWTVVTRPLEMPTGAIGLNDDLTEDGGSDIEEVDLEGAAPEVPEPEAVDAAPEVPQPEAVEAAPQACEPSQADDALLARRMALGLRQRPTPRIED